MRVSYRDRIWNNPWMICPSVISISFIKSPWIQRSCIRDTSVCRTCSAKFSRGRFAVLQINLRKVYFPISEWGKELANFPRLSWEVKTSWLFLQYYVHGNLPIFFSIDLWLIYIYWKFHNIENCIKLLLVFSVSKFFLRFIILWPPNIWNLKL